jgi:hypothetical protein
MDQDQKRREFAERMRQPQQPKLAEANQHGDCPPQADEEDRRNRQGKAVEMFTVCMKNGDHHAFSYGFLHPLDFVNGEIVANFMTHTVRLRGKDMGQLFERMRRKVADLIHERDELQAEAKGEKCYVTHVTIQANRDPETA